MLGATSIPKLPRETSSRRLWVAGFQAQRFIRRNLTLFEIQKNSFVLYAFISKNRHEQDSVLHLVYELQSI